MKVKRIDKSLPLPKYATKGSVGLDTYVREERVVLPYSWETIPLNLVIQAPEDAFIGVLPRSSTFKKTGLLLANSLGVVDRDYCGPEDEILALVYNTTDKKVYVHQGDRLFQLLVINCETPEIEEVNGDLQDYSRNGFGSTGEDQL
jgi:dUTP pyrophosphatase